MAAVESAVTAGATTQDLYSQYSKQIYSYCLHKLRSREEAEDAVQTTFMNAFRSLQRGATTQFEQAWLFKIAQNVCFARQSSSSKRLRLEAPNDFEVLQEIVPSRDGEQPLELMGLDEALEQMPENQRRAILLREWQGLSYREIAEELDLSQASVEMLIFRARRALAGALEEPEGARGKKLRAGRRVGALGSLIGALKTLFGGGAAIKAVSLAAAAIAVVGESANHTIVHSPAAKAPPASAVAPGASASASDAHSSARGTSAAAGSSPTAVVPIAAQQHAPRAHVAAGAVASHTHSTAHPRAHAHAATSAPPPTVAPTPATPAPQLPAAAPAAPAAHQDPPKTNDRQTSAVVQTPVTAPAAVVGPTPRTTPGNGNGSAYGRNKDKGDHGNGNGEAGPPPAPAVPAPAVPAPADTVPVDTAPVVTAPAVTAPVVTTTASPAPVAPDDHGNAHGNGNGRGHTK